MAAGRLTLGAVTVSLLMVLAGGCSLLSKDDPDDDADAFARALSEGDLTGVSFAAGTAEDAQAWWDGVREGMGDSSLAVSVDAVEEADDAATATLSHRWALQGSQTGWSYRTTVPLAFHDDTWTVDLSPGAVVLDLAEGERLALSSLTPERGDIVGAGGRRLVTDRPVLRFGIDKTLVEPAGQQSSARELARLVDIDPGEYTERVAAAGDEAFVEAIVLRQEEVSPRTAAAYESIPGARGVPDELPLAPTREFARPILGTVGPVTAEMVEESAGSYAPGDVAGLSGLQARYDEQLRGVPGKLVEAVDDESGESRELFREEPQSGQPLRVSIDVATQAAAEEALAGVGPASALVALRPSTGDLVAVASGPGSDGYPTGTLGQYAPGSTFKVASSLALLRKGLTSTDPVACPSTTVVDGKQFKNYSDYPAGSLGRITLGEAVAQSCNTAFVSQHQRVTPEELAEAAAALGVGTDYDVGFPTYFGSVPTDVSDTEHAAALIGQGRVLASPLAMAAVAGSVAAGTTVVPRLVAGTEVSASPQAPLTPAEASQLQELMAAVVREGSGSVLADVGGPPVLAKTGTAEFGEAEPPQTHGWMIAARGDLAVAVFVEVGESGSRTAGPVLEAFLRATG